MFAGNGKLVFVTSVVGICHGGDLLWLNGSFGHVASANTELRGKLFLTFVLQAIMINAKGLHNLCKKTSLGLVPAFSVMAFRYLWYTRESGWKPSRRLSKRRRVNQGVFSCGVYLAYSMGYKR
jgi:hypothetical protein